MLAPSARAARSHLARPAPLACLGEGRVGGGAQLIAVASGNGHVLYRIPLRRTGPAPFLIHHPPSVEAELHRELSAAAAAGTGDSGSGS